MIRWKCACLTLGGISGSAGNHDDQRPRLLWQGSMGRIRLAAKGLGAKRNLCRWHSRRQLPGKCGVPSLVSFLHKLISERGHKQIFQTSDGRFADLEQDAMQKCLNEYFFKTQVKAGETFRNLDSLQESGGGQGDLAGRSVRMVSEVEPFAAQECGGHSAHVDRWKPQV